MLVMRTAVDELHLLLPMTTDAAVVLSFTHSCHCIVDSDMLSLLWCLRKAHAACCYATWQDIKARKLQMQQGTAASGIHAAWLNDILTGQKAICIMQMQPSPQHECQHLVTPGHPPLCCSRVQHEPVYHWKLMAAWQAL